MTNTDINDKTQTIKEELDTLLEHSDELVKRIEDDVRAHSKEEAKHIVLPMIPMRHMNVFPGVSLTFEVARKRSRAAVHAAMNSDEQRMFLVSQRSLSVEWPRDDDIFHVGTQVRIREMIQLPGREVLRVRVDGLERARLISRESAVKDDEWDQATIQLMPSSTEKELIHCRLRLVEGNYCARQLYAATSGRLSMDAIMTLNALDNQAEQTDIIF